MTLERILRMAGRGRDPRTPLVVQLLVVAAVFSVAAIICLLALVAYYWIA